MNESIRNGLPLIASLALLAATTGCSTVDLVNGGKVNNMFSLDEDVEMGGKFYSDFIAEMKKDGCAINRDPKAVAKLNDMVARISAASHAPSLPYEVTLVHTNIPNAMAFPGGKIVVLEGLWDPKEGLVKDDDELAAVVAHELAHVNCRHSTEELTRQMPVEIILGALALYAEYEDKEEMAIAVSAAFLLYQGLWVPKYSRDDEAEADEVGLTYMARAGYDPRAAARLWKRVHQQEGEESSVLALLSTHPTNKDRYEAIERQLPAALALYETARQNPATALPNPNQTEAETHAQSRPSPSDTERSTGFKPRNSDPEQSAGFKPSFAKPEGPSRSTGFAPKP